MKNGGIYDIIIMYNYIMGKYAVGLKRFAYMRIILASKSPRRKEILENLGLNFEVIVADADENCDIKDPCALVEEIASRKGRAVVDGLSSGCDDTLVIACDTLVYAEGEFLGKPRDREDAVRMMKLLSGKEHSVISGVYLWYSGKEATCFAETKVSFDGIADGVIESYVDTPEPYDKAGAYAIQSTASIFISGIKGDYFNVVGLPVNALCNTLKEKFEIDIFEIRN